MSLLARLPEPGTTDDMIERLVRYVEMFMPDWADRVEGASDGQIAELERLWRLPHAGLAYPASFRRYLSFMGIDDDGFMEDLHYARGYYRGFRQLRELYLDPTHNADNVRELPIVAGCWTSAMVCLDLSRADLGEPPVTDEFGSTVLARSWESQLFRHAAEIGERQLCRHSWWLTANGRRLMEVLQTSVRGAMNVLAKFGESRGFSPAWFSDDQCLCLVRDDVMIWALFEHGVSLQVSGDDDHGLQPILRDLVETFGTSEPTPIGPTR